VAPDAFVKLGVPDTDFKTWMTWERGTPELAVEIVSDTDASDETWRAKLERYHEIGVRELVRFDSDAAPGQRLRIWDRLEGDLVERDVAGDTSPCVVLGLYWVVAPVEGIEEGLRLARRADGGGLLRSAAERLAELEAELARRE
jgi:Uma2 family endonuclease